jgi:hypothetical protein
MLTALYSLCVQITDRMQRLEVEVMDEDVGDDDDSMGRASLSLIDLVEGVPKMVASKLRQYNAGGIETDEALGEVRSVFYVAYPVKSNHASTAIVALDFVLKRSFAC